MNEVICVYFPFLRGRQFDLIAIRELLEKGLISENIVPIIEPVKLSSTLISTLSAYNENQREILIIQNPCVGNFEKELENHELYESYIEVLKSPYITITHILNEDSVSQVQRLAKTLDKNLNDIAILHKENNLIDVHREIFSGDIPRYNIVPEDKLLKRKLKNKNLVILQNNFIKQKNNKDYAKNVDEFFSQEHLYFESEGLIGFSDYSVVGDQYIEGGFAPFAIAIHIIYLKYDEDYEDKILRIRHLVSDSNNDIRDPALKCAEALQKLVLLKKQVDSEDISTYAMQQFLEHYRNGSYPGLPSLKKLSLMHHIELVDIFLRGE